MTHISNRIQETSINVLKASSKATGLDYPFSTSYTIRLSHVKDVLKEQCKKNKIRPEFIIKILEIK